MTDYSAPINSNDLNRAKTFYDIVCWGGLLIVLLRQLDSGLSAR